VNDLLLGIDLGTSAIKVGLFTPESEVVRLVQAPTPIKRIDTESAEHDARDLWDVTATLIREVVKGFSSQIKAVGISSFGESGVLVNTSNVLLEPRMLAWFDARPKIMLEELEQIVSLESLRVSSGLMADHTYSLLKILWLRLERPELFTFETRWLSTADWIAFKLTGKLQMGLTQASRTLLLDLKNSSWNTSLAQKFGLQDVLAPLRMPGESIGTIMLEAANMTGLELGIPVLEAAHDQTCAAFALGVSSPGAIMHACGTVETFMQILQRDQLKTVLKERGVVVGHHALQDQWYAMTTFRAAGSTFDWFVRTVANQSDFESTRTRILELAGQCTGDTPLFVPHLRSPSDDPFDTALTGGMFLGLFDTHDLGHLTKAVLEGLCLESNRTLKRLQVTPSNIRAVGGSTQSEVWMQCKANIFGLPLEVFLSPHASALGAALLAWHHLGNQVKPGSSIRQFVPEYDSNARKLRYARVLREHVRLNAILAEDTNTNDPSPNHHPDPQPRP
jgi:sugar (pentulose or hexulose) kinase